MAEEPERARKALRDLNKALKSVHGEPQPKEVHKLRTATRRVEAIASALPPVNGKRSHRLLKSIEPVRKAAGGVRDMDVLMANARKLARHVPGDALNRLLEALTHARQQNAAELQRALDNKGEAARDNLKKYTKQVLSALSQTDSASAHNGNHSHADDRFHAEAMKIARELGAWPPFDESNIHDFRLKVKQLRYILQLDADADPGLVEALGAVQRHIGEWHDWRELEEIARELLDPNRDSALIVRIAQSARRRYGKATSAANALRGKYLAAPVAVGI
jgi:CHAD domain-containing protein